MQGRQDSRSPHVGVASEGNLQVIHLKGDEGAVMSLRDQLHCVNIGQAQKVGEGPVWKHVGREGPLHPHSKTKLNMARSLQ